MELDDKIYEEITELSERGDAFADNGKFEKALQCFNTAYNMLPEPVYIWEASTWLLTSIGDMLFQMKQYEKSANSFFEAQKCPDGIGNPFICARIGECLYEMNNPKSKEYLLQAYMLEGKDIFSDVDSKYYLSISDLV